MIRLTEMVSQPIQESIAVDASCIGNPGPVEYKGVYVSTGKVEFQAGPFPGGTNNIGEFLAIVHALAYCKKNNLNIPIYSDSQTALSWIKAKRINTTMKPNANNTKIFELIDRATKWLKTNSYSNQVLKWETNVWGEIPSDFGRKE